MLVITHAVTGAVIGQVARSSPIAFIIGAIVHFIMDMIPHGDSQEYTRYKETGKIPRSQTYQLVFDAIIVIFFTFYVLFFRAESNWGPILWGIIGSVLPDLLVGIHECKPSKATAPFHKMHFRFHDTITNRWKDLRFRYAVILQILAIIIAMNYFI